MGCQIIRKINGRSEYWCDQEQDIIDDWLDKKFGKVSSDEKYEAKNKKIYQTILKNKRLFNEGYKLVKKGFHSELKPPGDMSEYEYMYHLCFALGLGDPEDNEPGKEKPKLKTAKGILSHNELIRVITSGKIRRD